MVCSRYSIAFLENWNEGNQFKAEEYFAEESRIDSMDIIILQNSSDVVASLAQLVRACH